MPEESHLPDRYNTKVGVMEEACSFQGYFDLKKRKMLVKVRLLPNYESFIVEFQEPGHWG